MNDISKESRKVLKVLLKEYKERRQQGQPKADAIRFTDSVKIHDDYFPDWSYSSIEYVCRELSRQEYLKCSSYNNISTIIFLTDKAILAYENDVPTSFRTFIKHIWDVIKTVLSVLKP